MKSNRQPPTRGKLLFDSFLPTRRVLNLAILVILSPVTLYANPDVAQIINGQVNIDSATPGVTNITNSPNAIIHWQNFNIAQNEITRFIQQNGQSAVLNRIIGENPSEILGQLLSNGKVFLINPNGIVFGAGSVIDTQGLVASSLNLSDADFLKGNYHFIAGPHAGDILNEGIIRAGKDGNIVLIAPSITNNGIIKSEGGQITLAAGQALVLTNLDDPDIRFEIQAPANAVLNLGKLLTEGGAVNVFAGTIRHSGEINADGVEMDAQGHVKLIARQDIKLTENSKISANNRLGDAGAVLVESKTGTVSLQGDIAANAARTGKGGHIEVLGEQVGVLDNARIAANGGRGGGEILVGGDQQGKNTAVHNAKATFVGSDTRINADANIQGNGGKVIVWSDKSTRASGHISAKGGGQGGNGGFVETSGKALDASGIQVNASAPKGKGGQWLLDPNNITIQALGNDSHVKGNPDWTTENDDGLVTTGSIQTALNNGTSVTVTTGTAGTNSQAGNITVASSIVKSVGGDASLSLSAHNNIAINAPIIAKAGKLDLTLTPDFDATGGGMTTISRLVDLNAGTLTLNSESQVLSSGVIHNAVLTISELGASELNGPLDHVSTVNIAQNATLTINRATNSADTVFNNNGSLDINAFFIMNTLNLNSGSLSGSGNVMVTHALNFKADTALTGSGILTTSPVATTTLAGTGVVYADKQWNNAGTVDWSGPIGIGHTAGGAAFTNLATGNINIHGTGVRQLNTPIFNNHGGLNLSGGTLQLLGSGNDTGSYQVTGTGLLQFLSQGIRNFVVGAEVSSINTVTFGNGSNNFYRDSSYTAPQTNVVSFGALNFNTGTGISLSALTVDNGVLGGGDAVTITDNLTISAGTLAGTGKLTTAAASVTTLADTGTVYLNKRWDNLGVVNWQNADVADNGKVSTFTNATGGTVNIGNAGTAADKEFAMDMARFNNQGVVNLSGGLLKVVSPGTDTGSYQASGNGQLQFWYGLRLFDHAEINSPNTVTFSNGKNYFRNGAAYSAGQTDVSSEAVLNFSTQTAISLPKLTLDGGTLEGSDTVTVSDIFNFHAGTVKGGVLTTTATAVTTLADKDTVYLGKTWDNFGSVSWDGAAAIKNPSNINAAFNNRGIFTIHSRNASDVLEISLGSFNNSGTLNLANGLLMMFSPGTDTGSYQVSAGGELQFWTGTRVFGSDAAINSANKVTFAGDGKNTFNPGSNYAATETEIDRAKVIFNTGGALNLPTLSISNGAMLNSSDMITVSKSLDFSTGVFTGGGGLTTLANATVSLAEGSALLDSNWENYGTVNFGAGVATIDFPRTGSLPIRHWNNYGSIFWQGGIAPANGLGGKTILTNKATGVYNISSSDTGGIRELKLGGFNNEGTVNLTDGILHVLSPGIDTGIYKVTGTGQLQFRDNTRIFDGADITSTNPVSFIDSTVYVNGGSSLTAPTTVIEGGTFNIITALSLDKLLMSSGTVNNAGGLTTAGLFDWSGGTLFGKGAYQFNHGFAYTGGAMSASGTVDITDNTGVLSLPSMTSISRLNAHASGQLILTGDITASSRGTAIVLAAGTQFTNPSDSLLSTPNGRWLIAGNTPAGNTLGGLTADFKHYGCSLGVTCNDGFDVGATNGNGLLYGIVPVLSVTPGKTSSVYGDGVNFPATYTGFIDGDDTGSTGIGGAASYAIGGTRSGAGYYHVGSHELRYLGGLTNQLGYQFKDNAESVQEWAITQRDLSIIADPQNKLFGEFDPILTYKSLGLIHHDVLSGALGRITGEAVGRYAITQGSLAASADYQLAYSGADLTIEPVVVSVPPEIVQHEANLEQNQIVVLTLQSEFNGPLKSVIGNNTPSVLQTGVDGDNTEKNGRYPLKQCQ